MLQHKLAPPAPRLVARLAVSFLLDSVRAITRHLDGDLLGGLVFLALLQVKLSASKRGEGREPISPRPLSVQSLAHSLRTPPETTRRCVTRLIARNLCRRVGPKGVVIPDSALAAPPIADMLADIRSAFWRMLVGLRAINFDFDVMGQAPQHSEYEAVAPSDLSVPDPLKTEFPATSDPAIDRAILEFGLRVVDGSMALVNDHYALACVAAAIMSGNASRIAHDPDFAWRYATYDVPPPDDVRRPVTSAEVSQMLGIPYETTRRYVNLLVSRGHCIRDAHKGLIIPMELLQRPDLVQNGLEMLRRFMHLIGELKRLGFDFRAVDRAAARSAEAGSSP